MDREKAKRATLDHIQNMKNCLNLFPAVSAVIRSFDGKMYNRRVLDALRTLDGVNAYMDGNGWLEIYSRFYYKDVFRTSSHEIYYFRMNKRDFVNKRVNAATWEQKLKENMIHLYQDIKRTEAALERIDDILTEYDYIDSRVDQLRREVPYIMQDWFKCGYYLRVS